MDDNATIYCQSFLVFGRMSMNFYGNCHMVCLEISNLVMVSPRGNDTPLIFERDDMSELHLTSIIWELLRRAKKKNNRNSSRYALGVSSLY